MKILKKLMISSLIATLSLSMVACNANGNNSDGNVASTEKPATSNEANSDNQVLATVNGVEIHQEDLDKVYNSMLSQYTAMYGEDESLLGILEGQKPSLLESLINEQLLLQKAKELGIECTDEEVAKIYDGLVAQYGEEYVSEFIKSLDLTVETYKEKIKEGEILAKVQDEMLKGDVNITDEAVEEYYNKNTAEFTTGAGGNMEHILVKVSDTDDEAYKKKSEEAVKTIEEEFAAGATFEELKEKYTAEDVDKDMYIVEDLGFRQYEEPGFDPLFLEGAKTVKEGEVSPAVKSSFGYHFIKVDGIKGEEVASLEEVKDRIKATLEQNEKMALYEAKLAEWTKEAEINKYEDRIQ